MVSRIYKKWTLSLVLCAPLSCSHSQSLKDSFFALFDRKERSFVAQDKNYFPLFILDFFHDAKPFQEKYAFLQEARMDVKLIEVKKLTQKKEESNERNLNWSLNGNFLGYEIAYNDKTHIIIKNLTGEFFKEIAVVPTVNKHEFLSGLVNQDIHSYNAGLQWEPGGERYSFISNGGEGDFNIYVGSLSGDDKIVERSPAKDGYAKWNPKRNELVFVSSRTGNGDIYLANLDTSEIKRLSFTSQVDIFPSWLADGSGVMFSSGDAEVHHLYLATRNSGDEGADWNLPVKFTSWDQDDLCPTVSPDGKLVAFYSTSREKDSENRKLWNLHVLKIQEGKTYTEHDLAHSVVAQNIVVDLNSGPAWSPDSEKIFYIENNPDSFNPIIVYNIYTSKRLLLETNTRMNRDLMMSSLGVLSFRAQNGVWDQVYLALTNQGEQLQTMTKLDVGEIHYMPVK